ncbi:FtsK/SpoIIIE domain-containing protein [Escherichia coli]
MVAGLPVPVESGVNTMILSMFYKAQPEDVRFIVNESPKMLELSVYLKAFRIS